MLRRPKLETVIYFVLWVIVTLLYLLGIMRSRSYSSQTLLDWPIVGHMLEVMTTFLVLFLVNNLVLIPKLLLRNRMMLYLGAATALVLIVWGVQTWQFLGDASRHVPHSVKMPPGGRPFPKPLIPLPIMLDVIYDMLIIGCNIAIRLIFVRYEEKLESESLMKADAENQLAYLKAQINPHFYMNMLNNIHGMIEVDGAKAQDMVIAMSRLMRYMLYDSSHSKIALSAEIDFVRNYMDLMRLRYPADKVRITADYPAAELMTGIAVAPLVFLAFVENAFKHGISYREESFVAFKIEVSGESVLFSCINSRHPAQNIGQQSHGIGLQNVRRRLDLIYGNHYVLEINQTDSTYSVNLSLPRHEDPNTDN